MAGWKDMVWRFGVELASKKGSWDGVKLNMKYVGRKDRRMRIQLLSCCQAHLMNDSCWISPLRQFANPDPYAHTSKSHFTPPNSQRTAAQLWSFLPENLWLNRTFHAGMKKLSDPSDFHWTYHKSLSWKPQTWPKQISKLTHHAPTKKGKENSLQPSLTNQGSRASHSRTASGWFNSTSFAFSSLGTGTVFLDQSIQWLYHPFT